MRKQHVSVASPWFMGIRLGAAILVGALIWFVRPPGDVSNQAWQLFAIFVATIVGIITQPLPMGAVAVGGIAAVTLTGTLGLDDALSGFGHPIIWLVVMAFFISRGFITTGLGARIAYRFMKLLGRRTIGLGYSLIATALVLAFFSNLFSSMTHYGTGPAPVLYGAGYVPLADWWKVGAIISVVNIVIWMGIGGLWWKLLGIW